MHGVLYVQPYKPLNHIVCCLTNISKQQQFSYIMKKSCTKTILFIAAVACLRVGASSADESDSVLRRRDTKEERYLQTPSGVVNKLVLINARTNTAITALSFGQVINVASLVGTDGSAPQLNINATVSGSIGSVRFGFNNNPGFRNEAVAPYALCGNTQRKFNVCPQLGNGTHTVTATPMTNGIKGVPVRVMFTIINTNAPVPSPVKLPISAPVSAPVTVPEPNFPGLRLIYTDSYPSVFVMELQFGMVNIVDLQKLNLRADNFNIEVLVGSHVKSVEFSNGRGETSKPLAYCGNAGDNFHTCEDLKVGATTKVTITAYSEPYGGGTIIAAREATIQIIRSSSPITPMTAPVKAPVAAPVRVPVPVAPPIAPVPGCPLPKVRIESV